MPRLPNPFAGRRRRSGLAAVVVGAALAVTACGTVSVPVAVRDAPTTTTSAPATVPPASNAPTTASSTTASPGTTAAPRTTTAAARPAGGYQDELQRMIDDIRSFWKATFPPLYGKPYTDLTGGVIRVTQSDVRVPACGGGRPPRYRDLAGNAYYCRDETADYIAYDDSGLFPKIYKRYGTVSLGLVMAHEWGHAIQARAGVNGSTILLEQQADCFAGAWLAHVASTKPAGISYSDADLTGAIGGFLSYADPAGITVQENGAHGSGFDRVGAFQDGFANGAKKCVTYATNLPPTFALPFGSQADYESGGNLPFDEVEPLMAADLDRFWTSQGAGFAALAAKVSDAATVTRCNGTSGSAAAKEAVVWCADTGIVAYDVTFLRQVYEEGDFALGLLFGNAWAQAAQQVRKARLDGRDALLQADCYVGAWTRSTIAQLRENQDNNPDRKLSLSPGDLDEGIRGLLAFGPRIGRDTASAGPFDRIAAFRKGVVNGIKACPA